MCLKYNDASGGVTRLRPESLKVNNGNGDVNQVSNGGTNDINQAKSKTQVSFAEDHKFYYFTYNVDSDFESGYSTNYINFENKDAYAASCSNPGIQKKQDSPLTFMDNVEIKEMNFISGT